MYYVLLVVLYIADMYCRFSVHTRKSISTDRRMLFVIRVTFPISNQHFWFHSWKLLI